MVDYNRSSVTMSSAFMDMEAGCTMPFYMILEHQQILVSLGVLNQTPADTDGQLSLQKMKERCMENLGFLPLS